MKIYLSKSNECLTDDIEAAVKVLEQNGNEVIQYIKGIEYDPSIMYVADAVVCIIPLTEHFRIGKGQYFEISTMLAAGKPVWLYKDKRFCSILKCLIFNPQTWKCGYGQIEVGTEEIPDFIKKQ